MSEQSISSHAVLSRFRVVLSRTSHSGNLGSVARAMKTMGMHRLYLADAQCVINQDSYALSSHAEDLLEQAVHCSDLSSALAGSAWVVGFTARAREHSAPVRNLREAVPFLCTQALSGDVALVLGNERHGLTNQELALCHFPVTIPADPAYSALNLASAVQLICYEIRMALCASAQVSMRASIAPSPALASYDERENFYAHLESALRASGFLDPQHPKRLMPRLRRLFDRSMLEREEVQMLRGALRSLMKFHSSER